MGSAIMVPNQRGILHAAGPPPQALLLEVGERLALRRPQGVAGELRVDAVEPVEDPLDQAGILGVLGGELDQEEAVRGGEEGRLFVLGDLLFPQGVDPGRPRQEQRRQLDEPGRGACDQGEL